MEDLILAVDPGAQAIGLIFNGLLTAAGFLLLWLLRLAYKAIKSLIEKVDHIDDCLDRTQAALQSAIADAQKDIEEIKEAAVLRDREHVAMREEIAYLKALVGVGLHEPIGELRKSEGAPP